jgi:proteic killer suppression protein
MIRSFADKDSRRLADRQSVRRFREFERAALIKLRYLDSAVRLDDLRSPPGNRLEALKGDRKGQYAIRINRQWRICFRWADGDVWDVEIVDYHD